MTTQQTKTNSDALTTYLAVEARHTLQLIPMYRDMADFQRRSADGLNEFLEGPYGRDIDQLRGVVAVLAERIRDHAKEWDRRADEAEKFVIANLPREMAASC